MRYLLGLLIATPVLAATVDSAYYAPDRGVLYKWYEGAQGLQEFVPRDYRAAGYLYLYVRNGGTEPISPTGFTWNGQSLDDLRAVHEAIWWRLLPRPLAPGMIGEVMVRLRNPVTETGTLAVSFDDGTSVSARIAPEPNPLRVTTIGFSDRRDRVFLVAETLDGQPREVERVLLDDLDVTAKCRLLAPRFIGACSPVSLRLPEPLALGSYHTYTVITGTGDRASACARTLDAFVPLGSYGYSTVEEYARNGCNSYANFRRSSQGLLDDLARLGMRGVSMIRNAPVEPYEVQHPGLYAHYLMDEPDCGDYFQATELPHALRIGFLALEIERRAQTVREGNPTRPSFLTIDLTYKPANYYVYGPIADILNPDCYPISIGADATMVREVVETAVLAAGPRPVTFTFQGVMEGPRDPEKFAEKRFPRPNFALEQRVMLYYAIGAGARGLFNYIHCTENSPTNWSRGTGEFPDVWNEIGQVYRELEHVSPLLALSHPTKLATSAHEKLWLRTLLCGEEAALVAWVNDGYQQDRLGVRYEPLRDVRIALPDLPWLRGWKPYAVGTGGFAPLARAGDEVLLPRADVGGLILLTARDALVSELTARYDERQRELGAFLLAEWRRSLQRQAESINLKRLITGELGAYAVQGQGLGAYGMRLDSFWNPFEAEHNVLEGGTEDRQDTTERGATFTVSIPANQAGQPWVVYAYWGPPARMAVIGPDGQVVGTRDVEADWGGELVVLGFTPRKAGEHRISYVQGGPGGRGMRIAETIYVLPEHKSFPPLPVP
mgnify:FL=1